jgi:hypothetical protein
MRERACLREILVFLSNFILFLIHNLALHAGTKCIINLKSFLAGLSDYIFKTWGFFTVHEIRCGELAEENN